MNAAVGNFNAQWRRCRSSTGPLSAHFVASLGLASNAYTTQIEPHTVAEYAMRSSDQHGAARLRPGHDGATCSLGYFKQRTIEGEVARPPWPHKRQPDRLRERRTQCGLANARSGFRRQAAALAATAGLTIPRCCEIWGVARGHAALSFDSLQAGLAKLEIDPADSRRPGPPGRY